MAELAAGISAIAAELLVTVAFGAQVLCISSVLELCESSFLYCARRLPRVHPCASPSCACTRQTGWHTPPGSLGPRAACTRASQATNVRNGSIRARRVKEDRSFAATTGPESTE